MRDRETETEKGNGWKVEEEGWMVKNDRGRLSVWRSSRVARNSEKGEVDNEHTATKLSCRRMAEGIIHKQSVVTKLIFTSLICTLLLNPPSLSATIHFVLHLAKNLHI